MSNPPFTLQQLRAFQAVAATNSFTAAAKSLNLTQSAVSHSIRTLEEVMGVELFDRELGTRSYKLSGAGILVFNQAAVILSEVDRLAIMAESLETRPPRNGKIPKPSGKRYKSVAAMTKALKKKS